MKNLNVEKKVILLLLMNKNSNFSSSYNLIKVLSWWFDIIDYSKLFEELISEELILCDNSKIGNYEITRRGFEIFQLFKEINIKQIKYTYPKQLEKVEMLVNNLKENLNG